MTRRVIVSLFAVLFLAPPVLAATYDLDPAHTRIGFSAKHMVISNVSGKFDKFTGSFEIDDKGKLIKVSATVRVASLNTGVEKRDNHLRSPDFFDVKKFPTMTFVSKRISGKSSKYTVVGDLTIKGVTKTVILSGEMLGRVVDFDGNHRAGFHAEGKINRKDFGVNFSAVLETGGLVVSDEIKITLDIEGIMRK